MNGDVFWPKYEHYWNCVGSVHFSFTSYTILCGQDLRCRVLMTLPLSMFPTVRIGENQRGRNDSLHEHITLLIAYDFIKQTKILQITYGCTLVWALHTHWIHTLKIYRPKEAIPSSSILAFHTFVRIMSRLTLLRTDMPLFIVGIDSILQVINF